MPDYSNIREKTIFDFCNDEEVLSFITNQKSPKLSQYIKNSNQDIRLLDLHLLEYIVNNKELGDALFSVDPILIDWDEDVARFAERYRQKHNLPDE